MLLEHNGLSFIIPYYNKGLTVDGLVKQMSDILSHFEKNKITCEFVIVNDGSAKNHTALLKQSLNTCSDILKNKIILIDRKNNLGKSKSIIEGSKIAKYQTLIFLDADVAFSTQDVIQLASVSFKNQHDVVIADRSQSQNIGQSILRKFFSKGFSVLSRIVLGIRNKDTQAGLKAIPANWFQSSKWNVTKFGLDIEILKKARIQKITIQTVFVSTTEYNGSSSVKTVVVAPQLLFSLFKSWADKYFFFGLFLVLITNLRAFSLRSSVVWDARDEMWIYFRWIGSALRSGYLGDYFPNIVSGYVLAGNPQAGVFNVFYNFFSYLFPTNVLSINLVYLSSLFMIYTVSFLIGYALNFVSITSMFLGLSIVASGFVSGHSSHFSYIASILSFLFIFLGVLFEKRNHFLAAFICGLIGTYHLSTAGYPSIAIFGAQILFVYGLYQLIVFRRIDYALVLGCLAGVCISLPALLHVKHQLFLSGRGGGLDIQTAMSGSLPWYSLLNFFVPWLSMGSSIPGSVDPTMNRFHLLFLSPILLLSAFYFKNHKEKYFKFWMLFALLMTVLALGKNFYIRQWLAENIWIYRTGRFPSGEHRGFALIALALASAFVLQTIIKKFPKFSKYAVYLIFIDFCLVMAATTNVRYMRLKEIKKTWPLYQIEYNNADQYFIDAPRGCPFDSRPEFDSRESYGNKFSMTGYTAMFHSKYVTEFESYKKLFCEAGRLKDAFTQTAVLYNLELYAPGRIKFTIACKNIPKHSVLDWADTNDGLWALSANSEKYASLEIGPASQKRLRFNANQCQQENIAIEMIYRGYLSRFFRH